MKYAISLIVIALFPSLTIAGDSLQWESVDFQGCENVLRVGGSVYSGGQPHGEEAFHALAEKGIKTIISVDGAKPDVELAEKFGMRYVHLPIGYDGIKRERALDMARVIDTAEGPVYFHCHHGKHRGPAATAVGLVALELFDHDEAVDFLKDAGTSPKYQGLYEVVKTLTPPEKSELEAIPADFPSIAERPGFVDAMARMDRIFDNLELAEEADWQVPADHPDINPPHEALQLHEILHDLARDEEMLEMPKDFRDWLKESDIASKKLEEGLRENDLDKVNAAFITVDFACTACHDAYRNN